MARNPIAATAGETEGAFGQLGVCASEELLYEFLVEHPGASPQELAHLAKLSVRDAQLTLKALELNGMATHTPDRPPRYFASPPDLVAEALIAKKQEAFLKVRAKAGALKEKARKAASAHDPTLVEIIRGREAAVRTFEQIVSGAKHEVLTLQRPPYLVSFIGEQIEELSNQQRALMADGVRIRTLFDHTTLTLPGALAHIRSCMRNGEQVRTCHHVALKIIVVDHRIALLLLDQNHLGDVSLLVRPCALLDALTELFEIRWERATPVLFPGEDAPLADRLHSLLPAEASELLTLLANGVNNKTAAYQLGISESTLLRRLKDIMKKLGAKTPFQAGWLARGSIN